MSRSHLRANRMEMMTTHELRTAARADDGLSGGQVAQVARSYEMVALIAKWQYVCALNGEAASEADGWLSPSLRLAHYKRIDATLAAEAAEANAEAERQSRELERLVWESLQAKGQMMYAKGAYGGKGAEAAAAVEALPEWFEALSGYAEKLEAIKANKLGDWDAFNEWLRSEYSAEDLAEFTFTDPEDLDIYTDFRAKRAA